MNYNRLQKYHVIDKVVKNRRFGDMVVFGWSGTFAEPNGGPIAIDATREALFAWVLNKPSTVEALPESLKALAQYRFDRTAAVPNVPFQMLTALNLNAAEWAQVARAAGWRMVRMT